MAAGAVVAAPAPGTQPAATQPAAVATAPASQPGLLRIEPQPGSGRVTAADFQGLGNIRVPAEKPAIAKSDRPALWHDTKTRYKSALLFDESGGTGTGYDTLYVSLNGDETFAGKVATYKPATTDVSPETPGRNFEMEFENVTIAHGRADRPDIEAKITLKGSRNQDDPESQFSFGGRIYPPVPNRRWAVGTLVIDGKTVRAAIMDENGNARFDDRGGLNPQNPSSPTAGDVLLLAMADTAELDPRVYSSNAARYAQRVPLPEYLVVNSGTFQVKIEQSEDAVSVDLVPAEVPAATVELSENRRQENLTLTGTKTCVILTDVPDKVLLPADTYAPPYSGESPYEVEAEEGVTMGLPFPKGEELAIPVRLPDGKPAAGADYLVIKTRQYVQLTNGYFETRYGYKPKKIGADGTITVRADIENYDVIVVHDAGWAHLGKKDVEAKKAITLEPWGQVEGTVRVGGKVGIRETVALSHNEFKAYHTSYSYTATTDDEGKFRIERVVPRKIQAGRQVTYATRGTGTTSMTYVKVEPGKTATVAIGGTGRPVIGRLLIPEDARTRAAGGWTYGSLALPRDRLPVPPKPKNWMELEEEEWQEWWKGQRASMQELLEKMATPERPASFQLQPDYSFRIDDVPAGTYMLEMRIYGPVSSGQPETIGTVHQKIEVPPMPDGRSDEPLDLGEIPLPVEKKAKLADPAPALELTDVWGKPLRTADYRGKHLVLLFQWPAMGKKGMEQVKALHEEVGKSEQAAMVSIYMDEAPEGVAEFLNSRQMDWPQAFVDRREYPAILSSYGFEYPATLFLIDPQGRLVAREKDFDAMKTALAQSLAGDLKTPEASPTAKAVTTQPAAATQESAAVDPEVLQTAQAFWKAIAAGKDDEAAALATPAYVQGHPQAFAKLRELTDPSAVRIEAIATKADRAIALTSEMSFKGGTKAIIGMGLIRQGNKWLVRDLDVLPPGEARSRFVPDFLTGSNGELLAVQPAAATQGSAAVDEPEVVAKTVKPEEKAADATPSTQPAAAAEAPAPVAINKIRAEKPSPPAFTYTVPDVPRDAKVNLVFRTFPVEFAEEQCDQRIIPWLEASPRPAMCKSDKALMFDVERRHVFEVRMVLDESGGTDSGYDTLYVDTNLTGDFSGAKVYKASKFTGKTGVEGGKVVAWFENVAVEVGRWEGRSTAHIQVFLQEPKADSTDAEVMEGWAIPQNWAVGTASIDGKAYPAAMLDRNWNDNLTDNAGFRPEQYPAMLARGDYLILGEPGSKTLVSGGTLGEGGSARVIRTDTIVLDSAVYQTAVEQTDEGMSLRFQPIEVAIEKKRVKAASGERLVLLGWKTSVILNNPSAEAALPEDTYLALVNLQGPAVIVQAKPAKMAAGMSAAPFEIQTLEGKPLKLEDCRGRHVVLCFWASWAKPCQADLPHLKAVHERFGKAGKIAVIGLSMDDDADTTREFLARTPLPWPQCFLDDAHRAEVAGAYGVDSVPATFLIDPLGRIVAKDLRGPAIEAAVAGAVAGRQ
jgi:peroxiredoxin